jgi:hypothetical protein
MKVATLLQRSIGTLALLLIWRADAIADPFPLALRPSGHGVQLSWPTAITNGAQEPVLPEYEVQYSTDLREWKPIGGKVRGIEGLSGPVLNLSLEQQEGPIFYRVIANVSSGATNETGIGGAQVFGFDEEFSTHLGQLGLLSVQDFATNSGNIAYLPQLTWDPTTAQFWTNFSNTNMWFDVDGPFGSPQFPYNYVLDTNELGLFMTNGFVVSERLGSASFGDAYYRIFNADLPVFISADSVLHAWHRSYQSMLEEVEELQISTLLERVVSNMSVQLPQTWQQYGQGPLSNSILDADYFLTVARSLWATQQVTSALGSSDVDQQVAATLAAINNQVLVQEFPIFGSIRGIDFSQFIVRGHYTDSGRLSRYFRTMMWCARTDLRLVTFCPNKEDDIRQLGTAVVMNYLLNQSGQFGNWSAIEEITRAFVGTTDSMTFAQLGDLLASANIRSPTDVPDLLTLTNLQTRLLTGELGVQSIHSDFLYSPFSPEQVKLPRSFTICGQKFTLDSWAFSQVVFDRVLWTPDYGTNIIFGKVIRRKPSCLDAAFSVLKNDQVLPELLARMTNDNGVPFRDGPHLPYQQNLLAVRQTIDKQDPSVWADNIYTAWLQALRALSPPTTDTRYPESMRTRGWAMKTLNTQLASWTELRHDTLLYAKQSYTEPILCEYPAGFVEPVPEFWKQMRSLAESTANALSNLPLAGTITVFNHGPLPPHPVVYDLAIVRSNQIAFLTNFAANLSTLEVMSEKELAQEPFSIEEGDFIKNTIEQVRMYASYRQWDGWYPKLYYTNVFFPGIWAIPPCDLWDAMVVDVHTDLPDPVVLDPGAVIHEGTANVNLLLIAVDNGPNRMIYAGPVMSHYEFEVPGINRVTDQQWKANLLSGQKPPEPEWTKSYLVPGTITIPSGNQ